MDARAAAKDSASDDTSLFRKLQPHRAPVDKDPLKVNGDKLDVKPLDNNEVIEEISVAGRTKMPVSKPKQSPLAEKKEGLKTEESKKGEPEEDSEITSELNSILKRSPSTLLFSFRVWFYGSLSAADL